jgi:hypothetical protein
VLTKKLAWSLVFEVDFSLIKKNLTMYTMGIMMRENNERVYAVMLHMNIRELLFLSISNKGVQWW